MHSSKVLNSSANKALSCIDYKKCISSRYTYIRTYFCYTETNLERWTMVLGSYVLHILKPTNDCGPLSHQFAAIKSKSCKRRLCSTTHKHTYVRTYVPTHRLGQQGCRSTSTPFPCSCSIQVFADDCTSPAQLLQQWTHH